MGKKAKSKKQKVVKKKAASQKSKGSELKKFPYFIHLKNLAILASCVALFFFLKNSNQGYQWVFDVLIKNNLEVMSENKDLTLESKFEAKLGFNYRFLNFINENTPEDAVIIMPPLSVFIPEGQKSNFHKYITRRGWSNYFVHPRTLVFEDEKNDYPSKYAKATHVAIVNDWGYDKLNYATNQNNTIAVLPLSR